MTCSSCGTENRPNSRFCDHCGSPLASRCPSCGAANRADARFCASCGTPFRPDAPAPAADAAMPSNARPTPAASERRLVSVLFTDLVGFTTLAEDRDPEAVRELLATYFEMATRVVELHGGTVEKFIGDAVMAVWGAPVAHEDDAERAVRAALELVSQVAGLHPDLRARAAVLTGDAAVTIGATNQGMVAGDLVNTAARLQGVAEPGTVLVGEATRRAAEDAIVFEEIGEHSLKGKTSPVPAWRAVRVVANVGGQGRADVLEPPFVGRTEELRQLKEALHAVGRERRPRLVSITGPGGIGKSRLVWELHKYVDGVAEDVWWHRGRSPAYGEGIAFWALGEMVRRRAQLTEEADEPTTRERIAATLEEYIPQAAERDVIGPALLTLLGVEEPPPGGRDALFPPWRLFFERVAERGTTVLVFEDLQWADTGLLDFIDHMLEWSRGLPIMVVTLARPELFDRRPDWGAGRRQLTALALEPLADEHVREMLDALVPGLPADALAAIVGRTEGIPLYAVEMVRGLLAEGRIQRRGETCVPVGDFSTLRVPDSLRSLIASRLDALDPADRALVQDASVLGQVFHADALAAIGGEEVDRLEPRLRDLVRRELLDMERDPVSPERGQYKFVQSLIREVAYGTLARRDRRARHLAAARHYEALGDDELAGALASHYVAAHEASEPGPEADAVATQARLALVAAADRAAALGAPEQALRHLEIAISLAADRAERAGLLGRAANAAARAAVDARPMATAAIEMYEELGDRVAATRSRVLLGRILLDASEIEAATEVLVRARRDAEATAEESLLAETSATLARAHMRRAEVEEAIHAADGALRIAERLNLDEVVAEALTNKGSALNMAGRRREGAALLRGALDITKRLGPSGFELRIRNNLATSVADDDPAGATTILLEAIDVARQIGDRGMFNWMVGNVAFGLYSEGREWDEHLARARETLEVVTLPGDRLRAVGSLVLVQGPRLEGLAELRAELDRLGTDLTDPEARFVHDAATAMLSMTVGDLDDAFERAMRQRGQQAQELMIPAQIALHAAIRLRDPDRIRAAAAFVTEQPGSGAWSQAFHRLATGAVAAAEGRRADAVRELREGRQRLDSLGQRMEAALVALDALHLLPDDPEVRSWAASAREVFAAVGANAYLAALDDVLARPPTDRPGAERFRSRNAGADGSGAVDREAGQVADRRTTG